MSREEREAIERMEWAAEKWLKARAGGRDTSRPDRLIEEARRDYRRAERRRRQAEKRAR